MPTLFDILTRDMHDALAVGNDRKAAAILLRIRALKGC
jgi:hypothetical protein